MARQPRRDPDTADRARARYRWVPISWLSRPVPLLPGGSGIMVHGVAQDAPLGTHLLRQYEDLARKEA
jgi:hypothetical protein